MKIHLFTADSSSKKIELNSNEQYAIIKLADLENLVSKQELIDELWKQKNIFVITAEQINFNAGIDKAIEIIKSK